jgi:hypothetical protein
MNLFAIRFLGETEAFLLWASWTWSQLLLTVARHSGAWLCRHKSQIIFIIVVKKKPTTLNLLS